MNLIIMRSEDREGEILPLIGTDADLELMLSTAANSLLTSGLFGMKSQIGTS